MDPHKIQQIQSYNGPLPSQNEPPILAGIISNAGVERHSRLEPLLFIECLNAQEFEAFVALREMLPERHKLMLTPYSAAEYQKLGARLFLCTNNGGGYGLLPDGEIISVFSLPGQGLGRAIIEDAILRGGIKVECFDIRNKLPELYRQFGFVETQRILWDDSQAPAGWSFEKYGTPDVIVMEIDKTLWV